jgi:hypothetical protein
MKKVGLWVGLLLASSVSLLAQVTVEVTQDQDQFLPGEALAVAVRITNLSGQPLQLGADEDWLTFSVESPDALVVVKKGDPPVAGEFTLESSQVAIKRANLAPFFAVSHPGRYAIVATVHIKNWSRELTSPPRHFNIIEGAKLWEQEVGMPTTVGVSNAVPEVRKYMLQQANYLKGRIRLYLRITDSYSRAVCVSPIGPMVSFGRPEAQVDRLSNLHVLYQHGPFAFTYTEFDLDGTVLARQTHDYPGTSRPRLIMSDEGIVSVKGGVRRITRNDVPPPPPELDTVEEDSSLAITNAPATNAPAKKEKPKKKK